MSKFFKFKLVNFFYKCAKIRENGIEGLQGDIFLKLIYFFIIGSEKAKNFIDCYFLIIKVNKPIFAYLSAGCRFVFIQGGKSGQQRVMYRLMAGYKSMHRLAQHTIVRESATENNCLDTCIGMRVKM